MVPRAYLLIRFYGVLKVIIQVVFVHNESAEPFMKIHDPSISFAYVEVRPSKVERIKCEVINQKRRFNCCSTTRFVGEYPTTPTKAIFLDIINANGSDRFTASFTNDEVIVGLALLISAEKIPLLLNVISSGRKMKALAWINSQGHNEFSVLKAHFSQGKFLPYDMRLHNLNPLERSKRS
jgi:hypothetical protein